MPDTFSHTAPVAAARDRVWDALQNAETWSNIGPIDEVWDAEHDEDGALTGYRWSARAAGRTWKGTATTARMTPGEHMRLDLTSTEIVGAITVELHDHQVIVSMEASPRGMLATMFWGAVRGALEQGLPGQVEAFARSLEA
ncbi:MAG TPA: SRPBCC family protein [Acidimicrobiia bacterium]|nr:SRPBCC family protein [Acidimicrobiia bacterium]